MRVWRTFSFSRFKKLGEGVVLNTMPRLKSKEQRFDSRTNLHLAVFFRRSMQLLITRLNPQDWEHWFKPALSDEHCYMNPVIHDRA